MAIESSEAQSHCYSPVPPAFAPSPSCSLCGTCLSKTLPFIFAYRCLPTILCGLVPLISVYQGICQRDSDTQPCASLHLTSFPSPALKGGLQVALSLSLSAKFRAPVSNQKAIRIISQAKSRSQRRGLALPANCISLLICCQAPCPASRCPQGKGLKSCGQCRRHDCHRMRIVANRNFSCSVLLLLSPVAMDRN